MWWAIELPDVPRKVGLRFVDVSNRQERDEADVEQRQDAQDEHLRDGRHYLVYWARHHYEQQTQHRVLQKQK